MQDDQAPSMPEDPMQLLSHVTEQTRVMFGRTREHSKPRILFEWTPDIVALFPEAPFDWKNRLFSTRVMCIVKMLKEFAMMNDEDFERQNLKMASVAELRRVCQNLNELKTWRERTSWFPMIFQEENLNPILNSPLIINDTMKIDNQIATIQEQKSKLIGIFTSNAITENDMKKAMCYPLIIQRLNNQVGCKAYSFVCSDDELLFFELETSRWSHDRAYSQKCAMTDVIKLDTVHGICYFYSLIHTVANNVKYPWASEAFKYGPIYSKCIEILKENRRKIEENPHLIPKIVKKYRFNIHRTELNDETYMAARLSFLQIKK